MLSQLGTDISSLFPFVPRASYEFTYCLAFVPRNFFDSQDRLAFLVSTGSLGNHLFEKRVLLIQKVDRSGNMTSILRVRDVNFLSTHKINSVLSAHMHLNSGTNRLSVYVTLAFTSAARETRLVEFLWSQIRQACWEAFSYDQDTSQRESDRILKSRALDSTGRWDSSWTMGQFQTVRHKRS